MFWNRKYESPIEGAFDWDFDKYKSEAVTITPQAECPTMLGTFRLDFLIQGKLKVGVELDGKDFHDEFRDECRDAIILGEHHVDVIYRFRGKDVWYNVADMLYFMSKCDPWIFNDRTSNLKHLSSRVPQEIDPDDETHLLTVSFYGDEEDDFGAKILHRNTTVFRRSRNSKYRQHWNDLYSFALETKPLNVDALVESRKAAIDGKFGI